MKKLVLLGAALLSFHALADDASIKAELEKMGATNVKLQSSPLNGFRTAIADQGLLHISEDGRYIIQGKILERKNGKMRDITNQALMSELNALSDEMIVYPAKDQKHIVNVFMDTTCHYCHLFFAQLAEYNELGITVRFLAYPRSGLNSDTARQMEAIWSATDKVKVLNDAEKGELPKNHKTPNIVKKQYELGVKFGVTGTPNIVTENGELIGGYVEPKALLRMLAE